MNRPDSSCSASSRLGVLLSLLLCSAALGFVILASGFLSGPWLSAQAPSAQQNSVAVGRSSRNDDSPPLPSLPPWSAADGKSEPAANDNTNIPYHPADRADP